MRRLWAHILLAFTALVSVGTTFGFVFTDVDSSIEFSKGNELVYHISNKENEDEALESGDLEQAAKEMEARLVKANVTNYKIVTSGEDTIKVTLGETGEELSEIQTYLSFNGSLAIMNSNNDYALGSEFLVEDEPAYYDTIDNAPYVIIPVNTANAEYKAVLEEKDAGETEHNHEEGEEEEEETVSLYMWYDFVEGEDTYTASQSNSKMANKIFMTFDANDLYKEDVDENTDDDIKYLYYNKVFQDTDGDEQASATEIKSAFLRAKFFVNLLNAGELSTKVTYLYTNDTVAPWIENTISLGQHKTVAWSRTFVATLAAVAILSLLLVVFYRLGALSVATFSIVSVFTAISSIIWLGATFNVAGIVGLISVAIASLASGVIYLNKIKDEAYRGRSLKKANAEAGKKALLPIVDVNVVLIIIGVFGYILGGTLMRTFAVVTVIGGLASLILNTIGLRGMMWLATNSTYLSGKYGAFGIEADKVPNLMNEEKQTYFGPYAEKDLTKKKKPFAIATIVLFVATLAGMITFSVVKDSTTYNNGSTASASEIYFETKVKESIQSKDIKDILNNLYVYEDDASSAKSLNSYVDGEIKSYERSDYEYGSTVDDLLTVNYYYYVVELKENLTADYKSYYVTARDADGNITTKAYEGTLVNEAFESIFADYYANDVKASLKSAKIVNEAQPEVFPITLSVLVGIAVSALYLLLRYRLSRGLVSFIIPIAVAGITAGLFSLIHVAVSNYVVLAVPAVSFFTLVLAIIFMNRERELVLEDRTHNNSVENRNEIMIKANSSAFTPILAISILAIYLGVNFFGFGADGTSWLFLTMVLGMIIAIGVVATLYGPLSQAFFKLFSAHKVTKKAPKKKKAAAQVHKSAEPEEAVFIGIND